MRSGCDLVLLSSLVLSRVRLVQACHGSSEPRACAPEDIEALVTRPCIGNRKGPHCPRQLLRGEIADHFGGGDGGRLIEGRLCYPQPCERVEAAREQLLVEASESTRDERGGEGVEEARRAQGRLVKGPG